MSEDREKRRLRRKRNLIAKELRENQQFKPKRIDKTKKHILKEIIEKEIESDG
jgi:hypothetical protein